MKWLFVAVALLSLGCGSDSPTAPSPLPTSPAPTPPATIANIAGQWTGTLQYVYQGTGSVRVSMTLQQDQEHRVSGTWQVISADNDIRGEVAGQLSGIGIETRIVGTMTFSAETETGTGRCTGRASMDGPASPPSMRWSSPAGVVFDTCTGAFTDLVFTWSR